MANRTRSKVKIENSQLPILCGQKLQSQTVSGGIKDVTRNLSPANPERSHSELVESAKVVQAAPPKRPQRSAVGASKKKAKLAGSSAAEDSTSLEIATAGSSDEGDMEVVSAKMTKDASVVQAVSPKRPQRSSTGASKGKAKLAGSSADKDSISLEIATAGSSDEGDMEVVGAQMTKGNPGILEVPQAQGTHESETAGSVANIADGLKKDLKISRKVGAAPVIDFDDAFAMNVTRAELQAIPAVFMLNTRHRGFDVQHTLSGSTLLYWIEGPDAMKKKGLMTVLRLDNGSKWKAPLDTLSKRFGPKEEGELTPLSVYHEGDIKMLAEALYQSGDKFIAANPEVKNRIMQTIPPFENTPQARAEKAVNITRMCTAMKEVVLALEDSSFNEWTHGGLHLLRKAFNMTEEFMK